MIYKYAKTIEEHKLIDCPPVDSKILPLTCFHYIFEDIGNAYNFLPLSERSPDKLNDIKDKEKCGRIGLSCFTTKQDAKKNWCYWNKKKKGKFAKQVGNHLCQLSLSEDDGTTSELDENNHFNFYQYSDIDIKEKITLPNQLINCDEL